VLTLPMLRKLNPDNPGFRCRQTARSTSQPRQSEESRTPISSQGQRFVLAEDKSGRFRFGHDGLTYPGVQQCGRVPATLTKRVLGAATRIVLVCGTSRGPSRRNAKRLARRTAQDAHGTVGAFAICPPLAAQLACCTGLHTLALIRTSRRHRSLVMPSGVCAVNTSPHRLQRSRSSS